MPGATISGTTNLAIVQATNNGGSGGSALSGNDPLGTGVLGSSVGGNGVKGTNNSGTNAAVGALNFGSGPGITGLSVSGDGVQGTSSGAGAGVKAQSTDGTGVDAQGKTAGVYGVGTDVNAAGLWGVANTGTGAIGVYGTSSSGYGVEGRSSANNGVAVYAVATVGPISSGVYAYGTGAGIQGISTDGCGVCGQSVNAVAIKGYSSSGTGVEAAGNGPATTALRINNGAIRVTNAGNEANSPVFEHTVHTGAGGNVCNGGTYTIIDNPYSNNDPNAMLLVTPKYYYQGYSQSVYVYYNTGQLVACPANKWLAGTYDGTFTNLVAFNVMVIKP